MTDAIIEHSILMTFTQGAYFFLTIILSILFLRQYKTRIKLILGSVLAFFVLLHIKDLIIGYNHVTTSIYENNWINIIDMFALPLSGIFVHEAMKPNSITIKSAILHLTPFIILFSLFCIYPINNIFYAVQITSLIYIIVLVPYFLLILREADEYLASKKSCYAFIVIFIAFVLNWIVSCINPSALSDMSFYFISATLWAITCYLIEYKYKILLTQPVTFKPDRTHTFDDALSELFENEHLYLNASISINDIARHIGTNRSYLSEYFNHKCNTTFNDYINNLRIDYADKLMCDDLKSIEEIATSSGFNSVTTFRRAFVKKHGITPSQYRQKCKNTL